MYILMVHKKRIEVLRLKTLLSKLPLSSVRSKSTTAFYFFSVACGKRKVFWQHVTIKNILLLCIKYSFMCDNIYERKNADESRQDLNLKTIAHVKTLFKNTVCNQSKTNLKKWLMLWHKHDSPWPKQLYCTFHVNWVG